MKLSKEYLLTPEGQAQIKALDESIQRWRDKVSPEGDSDTSCPLCDLNQEDSDNSNCKSCLIGIDTNVWSCEGTPFYVTDHSKPEECQIMLDWLLALKRRVNDHLSS